MNQLVADILQREFDLLKQEMITLYDQKGMRASGKFADELEVEVNNDGAKLIGAKYAEQLQYGRLPGKQPPSHVIEEWIVDKGIANQIEGDISISSLAFLIARKIGREGWKRENYGGVNLVEEVFTPARIDKILKEVGDGYVVEFVGQVIEDLKTVA
jgi:hypothetical protein